MADKIFEYKRSRVASYIEELGYDPDVYGVDDILFYVYDGLIDDIRGNETDWPVVTGFSRASFYTDGRALWNDAPYAKYIEFRRNVKAYRPHPIKRYAPHVLKGLVLNALELIGAVKRDGTRRNLFETVEGLLEDVRHPLTGFVDLSQYRRYGARNRRLLRTYAPRSFDITDFFESFR